MKVCQNTGVNHNAHAQLESPVISIFNILEWLFPKKTTHQCLILLTYLCSFGIQVIPGNFLKHLSTNGNLLR